MVGVRIVGRMLAGERANPPSAPHIGLHQPVDHPLGAIGWHDSVGQAMTSVRGHGSDGALVAVQPQIVGALFLPPEALVELLIEAGRPLAHLLGALRLAPYLKCLRHPQHGVEGIALQLAQRVGKRRDAAILVPDGAVGALPTLAIETAWRPRLVFLEAVAVAGAMLAPRLEARLGVWPVTIQDRLVA